MLKYATEDEAELSHIGVLVVKHCGLLSGFADALVAEQDPHSEIASLRRDVRSMDLFKLTASILRHRSTKSRRSR